jgi:hypothetical protein
MRKLINYFAQAFAEQKNLTTLKKLSHEQNCLIVAPSFPSVFNVIARVCKSRTVYVAAGPIVQRELKSRGVLACMKTPQEIAGLLGTQWPARTLVFSFPDQTIGYGKSFEIIEINGSRKRLSIFEMLLTAKYKPQLLNFKWHKNQAITLSQLPTNEIDFSSINAALSSLMQHVLPLGLEEDPAWLAKNAFEMKSEAALVDRMAETIKDIEALTRTLLVSTGKTPRVTALLEAVSGLSKAIVGEAPQHNTDPIGA